MSFTVTKIDRLGSDSADYSNGQNRITVSYRIEVSEAWADVYEARVYYGTVGGVTVPAVGAAHPINSSLIIQDKSAKRDTSSGKVDPYRFIITAVYSPANFGSGPSGSTTNSKGIRVNISGVEQTILTQLTTDGQQITNAVGDIYPDPIEVTIYDEQISIEYEADSLDFTKIANARGMVNDAAITLSLPQGTKTFARTFEEGTLLCKSIDYGVTVPKNGEEGDEVWGVKVVLLYRFDGWDKKIPEKGYRWKLSGGALTDWQDSAAYLDEDGYKLAAGSPLVIKEGVEVYMYGPVGEFLETI